MDKFPQSGIKQVAVILEGAQSNWLQCRHNSSTTMKHHGYLLYVTYLCIMSNFSCNLPSSLPTTIQAIIQKHFKSFYIYIMSRL